MHEHNGASAIMLPPMVGWPIVALAAAALIIATLVAMFGQRRFRPEGSVPLKHGPRAEKDDEILSYLAAFRAFSKNAKLLLYRTALGSLAFPTWEVLFNLYLLSLGFDVRFVGAMLFWNWLLHGALAFPAGLISDRYGRRLTYLVSNSFLIVFTLAKLLTLNPAALLSLSALAGAAEGFHAVTGAPFMMENSTPRERTHLFVLYSLLQTFSGTLGRLASGGIAIAIAWVLHVGPDSAVSLRGAMIAAAPLIAASLIPIALMRESWARSLLPWWREIRSQGAITALVGTTFAASLGAGFVFPYFNVVFHERFHVPDTLVGAVLSVGTASGFLAGLFTPALVRRFGRVRTIVGGAIAAAAFTVVMGAGVSVGPSVLALVIGAYAGRLAALLSFSAVENQFSMELVQARERGVTAGLMHAASEFPMAVGTALAASFMVGGNWSGPYWWSAGLVILSYAAFAAFFGDARHTTPRAAELPEFAAAALDVT
jgi:MFS family permease